MKIGPIFVRLDPGQGVITECTPYFEDVASAAIYEDFRKRYTAQFEASESTCPRAIYGNLSWLGGPTPKENL